MFTRPNGQDAGSDGCFDQEGVLSQVEVITLLSLAGRRSPCNLASLPEFDAAAGSRFSHGCRCSLPA